MITALLPLPDELDRSYLGRLLRINGVRTETEIVNLLAQRANVAEFSRREICCVDLLSRAAHMELPQFVRRHTTLPLRRSITSYLPDLAHGSPDSQSMLRMTGMRLARPGAYFCVACIDSDQKINGMSYWRRDHQLRGVTSCSIHLTVLRYVDDIKAFLEAPSRFVSDSHVVNDAWAKSDMEHPGVQRFLEISRKLISLEKPIDVKIARIVLRDRASAQGLCTHGGMSPKALLSDQIVADFPADWLATVVPALTEKAPGVQLNQVDGVLYLSTSASSVTPYILACSVLFDSADEALRAMRVAPAVSRRTRNCQPSPIIDDDELRSSYLLAKGQYKIVVNDMLEGKRVVLARLRELGFPDLSSGDDGSLLVSAIAFFVDKKPLAESAALGGIGLREIEDLIRTCGGKLPALLLEMQSPRRGPGTGVLRIKPLTPREVSARNATDADRDVRLASSSELIV